MLLIPLVLAARAAAATAAPKEPHAAFQEDVTVHSRPSGLGVQVSPPAASKPVIDEVLRSLDLGKTARAPEPERIRVDADATRLREPFPEPPFLSLSPANIAAVYDQWTFEVLDEAGERLKRLDGPGVLKERLDWDGDGPNGRLALVAGRAYHYRFSAKRGDRGFILESDPQPLPSFSYKDYEGALRLEADLALLFARDKADFAPGSERWLDALAARLRSADARPDGSYRLELCLRAPKSPLAEARAKALRKRIAKLLVVDRSHVKVSLALALRGEAVAALLPPPKGPTLGNE